VTRSSTPPLPAVARLLTDLGANIRLARQRRRLTAALVAERAGISRPTLRAIERGDAGVTLGSVANVLHCLGLEQDLRLLGLDDALGRRLQDADLKRGGRERRTKKDRGDGS